MRVLINWIHLNISLAVSRTLETPLAVSSGVFSPSGRRSLVVDFLLHQRASTCWSCLTTARRAFCVTSYVTLSVWTRALSCLNSVATGQSAQEGRGKKCEPSKRFGLPGLEHAALKGHQLNKRQIIKDLCYVLFTPFVYKIWMSCDEVRSAVSHSLPSKEMLPLQHNQFLHLPLHHHKVNILCI